MIRYSFRNCGGQSRSFNEKNLADLISHIGSLAAVSLHQNSTALWTVSPRPGDVNHAIVSCAGGQLNVGCLQVVFDDWRQVGRSGLVWNFHSLGRPECRAPLKNHSLISSIFIAMTLNLRQAHICRRNISLQVDYVDDFECFSLEEHPYFGRSGKVLNPKLELREQLSNTRPRSYWHFIGRQDGVAVSSASLFLGDERIAGLYDVGVLPNARSRGLGETIVAHVLAIAREGGFKTVTLQTREETVGFFERSGFLRVGYFDVISTEGAGKCSEYSVNS